MQSFIFDRSWSKCLLIGMILNTAMFFFTGSGIQKDKVPLILNAAREILADPDGNVGPRFESSVRPDLQEVPSAN